MTRTEERLTDALRGIANTVREGTLPPLAVPRPERHPWRRRLAPVAAAAAVTLIALLALLLPGAAGGGRHRGGTQEEAGLPRYYLVVEGQIVVRATSGGDVGYVPSPGSNWEPVAVAAAGGGRFIGEFRNLATAQVRLYSFRLGLGGQVNGFSEVRGGTLSGFEPMTMITSGGTINFTPQGTALAVSPDGTRVALAVCPSVPRSLGCGPIEIAVVSLRTGGHEFWRGGLGRAGVGLKIPAISWGADGKSLVFLAQWCRAGTQCGFFVGRRSPAQVRTLELAAPGHSLAQGRLLLGESARYPDIVQAQLAPGGAAIAVVVLRSPAVNHVLQDLRVIRVPLGGRGQPRLLYHGRLGDWPQVSLSPDPSGRHWLLGTSSAGWIGGGQFHLLLEQGGAGRGDIWG